MLICTRCELCRSSLPVKAGPYTDGEKTRKTIMIIDDWYRPHSVIAITNLTREAGITNWYYTYLVKCQPLRRPTTAQVNACLPYLEEEMREIWPNTAILLGSLVAGILIGKYQDMTSLNGKAFQDEDCIWKVSCFNPKQLAHIKKKREAMYKAILDVFKRVKELNDFCRT